jgi:hypothetical protein
LWLIATTACAEETVPAAGQPAPPEPSAVQRWLELQSSGKAASSQPQPLSGQAMQRVHQRYLKGFEHPQPMYYKHDESVAR